MPIIADLYYFSFQPEHISRPPVVLMHGAGGNHLSWPTEIRRLGEERIFALDLPGHGKSVGLGQQSIDAYADQVIRFADECKLPRVVWVGHSMGSAIALSLALKYPERTQALILVGGGARLRVAPEIVQASSNTATFDLALQAIQARAFGAAMDERLKSAAMQRMRETRPAVLHGDFIACDNFNLMDKLSEIKAPTLVICGAEDQMTPVKFSEYLAEQIPHAQLSVVPEAGHMVMLEKPEAVAAVMRPFLQQIAYTPGM